jgi:hypothetical protein
MGGAIIQSGMQNDYQRVRLPQFLRSARPEGLLL